jgi:hypothetical protein
MFEKTKAYFQNDYRRVSSGLDELTGKPLPEPAKVAYYGITMPLTVLTAPIWGPVLLGYGIYKYHKTTKELNEMDEA